MTPFIRLLAVLLSLSVPALAQDRLEVMAGTSLIEDIVTDLGGSRVAVKTIIPAAACPGHYDIRTSDVAYLAQARIILLHDWQERMPAMVSILDAVSGARERAVVVQVKGNWMVPDRQVEAVRAVESILERVDPGHAAAYREKSLDRLRMVEAAGERMRERMKQAGLLNTPVMCDVMQRPFVELLGLAVVADYGRFEEMGPEALAKALNAAKAAGARLVLDNMQSTGAAGKALADDLGAAHATLSNFPGGYPGADTWEAAVSKNVDLILAALGK
ncbi:metal ABC transporter solute-binding protein, Zn/Mn family [Fundidesulfovibrio putealis]|uniref:metal ABC transporter solute-binding protein, Zn/Mn family n=1 Tax=Fundidesulfovibrio putealis TaxID=270496 RepID=UPI00042252A6|nr:zinc ABC transporter substrate-binding protein [Fundidesulfovibrio putealis]